MDLADFFLVGKNERHFELYSVVVDTVDCLSILSDARLSRDEWDWDVASSPVAVMVIGFVALRWLAIESLGRASGHPMSPDLMMVECALSIAKPEKEDEQVPDRD